MPISKLPNGQEPMRKLSIDWEQSLGLTLTHNTDSKKKLTFTKDHRMVQGGARRALAGQALCGGPVPNLQGGALEALPVRAVTYLFIYLFIQNWALSGATGD